MKNSTLLLFAAIILTIFSCRSKVRETGRDKVLYVNIDNPETTIDLKLSDLVDSVKLVPLETTEESLLGPNFSCIYAGNKYILISDRNGIYKFSPGGRFIGKLLSTGRGPGEIPISAGFHLYEKKDILLIDDRGIAKDYLLCYDVIAEKFLEPVKKWNSAGWGDFLIFRDSLIMGTLNPIRPDPDPNAMFIQNFKGKFVTGINSTRQVSMPPNQDKAVRRMMISKDDENFHLSYLYDDTLFSLNNNQLTPYMIASFSSPREPAPSIMPVAGERKIAFPRVENSCFAIVGESFFKGMEPMENGSRAVYIRSYYLLDLNTGKSSKIRSFNDNFIGKIQSADGETVNFPAILPNGRLYNIYNPSDLKGKEPDGEGWKEFPAGLSEQLARIRKDLDIMDNPVLLIGTIKKKL